MTAIKNRSPYICLFFSLRDNLKCSSINSFFLSNLTIFFYYKKCFCQKSLFCIFFMEYDEKQIRHTWRHKLQSNRISHIIIKKLNFRFSIVIFLIKKENIYLTENISVHICRSFRSKQFCIMTFFRISYNLTRKWNLEIDFFQVLTYYNFPNFSLIKKCKYLMKISKVIFHIELIPSHL